MNSEHVTIAGLGWAAVLLPAEWLSYGEKLLAGAVLALLSGFAYKAGGWFWDRITTRKLP